MLPFIARALGLLSKENLLEYTIMCFRRRQEAEAQRRSRQMRGICSGRSKGKGARGGKEQRSKGLTIIAPDFGYDYPE